MRKTLELTWIVLALTMPARAQIAQNMDISFMVGPASTEPQVLGSSGATVSGATGYSTQFGYGYMVARVSAASLWLELMPMTFSRPANSHASISGSTTLGMWVMSPGVRFMAPVQSRVSVYGVVGGGVGYFRYPYIAGGSSPYLSSNSTAHGVFSLGGGVDVRVIRTLSIRGEVRDFVSGSGLSGVDGIHHVVPLAGIALHF